MITGRGGGNRAWSRGQACMITQASFYIEVPQRQGGYQGYDSANTHVRLAAQSA